MAIYSETRTFLVNCDCNRYTPFRFAWLNRLGGFDEYTFRLKSTKTITAERQEYKKYLSHYNSTSDDFGYTKGDRGRGVYDMSIITAHTVISTWQTPSEHQWLEELFTSPAVYLIYAPDVNGIYWEPIIVTKNTVEMRNKKGYGNRLLSHNIEFVKAIPKIVQRG